MLGIIGGTFDPIHLGHLIIAEEVKEALGLETVMFIPAGQPRFREGEVTPAHHRLAMVRLAIAGNPWFRLSAQETERPGLSYTVDTLSQLRVEVGEGVELVFIIGWDALSHFPQWREPQRIVALCRLAVVPRPGCPPPDIPALEHTLPGIASRLHLLSGPVLGISSRGIRERVRHGRSIRYLVPEAVQEYIDQQGLYR